MIFSLIWNKLKLSVTMIESDFDAQSKHLSGKITELSSALDAAHDDSDQLHHRVAELETGMLETMANRKRYLDSVRQCCAELLSLNVGIANVEPVIRSVLKHVGGFEVQDLTTLVRTLTEMKVLACHQLSEELTKSKDVTLHSDGTYK